MIHPNSIRGVKVVSPWIPSDPETVCVSRFISILNGLIGAFGSFSIGNRNFSSGGWTGEIDPSLNNPMARVVVFKDQAHEDMFFMVYRFLLENERVKARIVEEPRLKIVKG